MKLRVMQVLAIMFLFLLGIHTGRTSELPPLNIPVCAKPPLLDGKLDDAVWQDALEIGNLYRINSDTPAPETTIKLLRDDAWLYIAAQCRNPNMTHLAQLTYEHDGAVITDDSLEIFLRPTPDDDAFYYYFALSFANIGREQRCNKAGLREVAWNPPWRSVTQRQADGWTAEIAIPLYCLETDDLSGLTVNILRNSIEVDLDVYGAKQGETRVHSTLRPDNKGSPHDFANFQAAGGMGGFKSEVPFTPQIRNAVVEGLRQDGGLNFYDLQLTLDIATAVSGKLRVQVMEDFGEGEVETLAREVELKGFQELKLSVPAGDLRERKVKVVMSDPADGSSLARLEVRDVSALNIIRHAFVGRSYYTSEDMAEIRVELGLPQNMLQQAVLVIEAAGRKVVEMTGLQPVMTPSVPVDKLALGDNAATIRIVVDGRELAAKTLNIIRLEPRPGYETQADFIKGVLLKDKQPIFPVGIFATPLQVRLGQQESQENDEALFKYLAEDIGFNFVTRNRGVKNPEAFMELAEKYGLYVMNSMAVIPRQMSDLNPPRPMNLPLNERLAIHRQWYNELEPGFIEDAKVMRDYKNLIIYYNGDEPNLVNPDERIAVVEWYWKTVRPLDPYRPMTIAYAKHIPHGDNWTRWTDMLAYDVYPRPYVGSVFSEPGLSTVYYAWQLRERCRQDNKIMWFVPLSNILDLERSPIGMNKAHILCQAYSAIIYGARGLWYFALGNVVGEETWDALRTISAQVKEMTPALVNGDIAQNVKYTPDNFFPRERKFPPVNAAVFKYPDGDYLLMAVNIMPFAVETGFKVGGLQSGIKLFDADGRKPEKGVSTKLLGGKDKLAVANALFSEKIEPYGVRAYRLKLTGNPAPVEVAVEMTPIPEEQAPSVDVPGIARQLMMSKNYMPNPCFAKQTNKDVPDFYRPYFCLSVDPFWGQKGKSDWYIDDTVLWNGHPSLRMFKRPYLEGGYKTRALTGVFYPPASKQAMKITFSVHARSETPNARLSVRPGSPQDNVKHGIIRGLTAEWQRYHLTFDLPPGRGANLGGRTILIMPSEGAVIWINGLQIEQGAEPTEFQDDSVLVKKK